MSCPNVLVGHPDTRGRLTLVYCSAKNLAVHVGNAEQVIGGLPMQHAKFSIRRTTYQHHPANGLI